MNELQKRDKMVLSEFLLSNTVRNKNKDPITHTRIGTGNKGNKQKSNEPKIYGGVYSISDDDEELFYKLYYEDIFVRKKKEYLTEVQRPNGKIGIDLDFRYNHDICERQHTDETILNILELYLNELKKILIFKEELPFDVFIFEKPTVNRLEDKTLTKDGIHILINIQMDHILQSLLRNKVLLQINDVVELPIINSWDTVLDDGISKGTTNWQLYGSRKPNHDSYELVQHYLISFDNNDNEFIIQECDVNNFNFKDDFYKLTIRDTKIPAFDINPLIQDEYEALKNTSNNKKKGMKKIGGAKIRRLNIVNNSENIEITDITNANTLQTALTNILDSLRPNEYYIKELHEYTQILGPKYYDPGSHYLNRQVAFALKMTDERLFLSWIMLRSKASDFDYDTIPGLYNDWVKYFVNTKENPITSRSITYWAKKENPDAYNDILNNSIDHALEESILTETEYDIASVLYVMYKDKYVCASLEKKGVWYQFKKHRWHVDKGITLRECISKKIYDLFSEKLDLALEQYNSGDTTEELHEQLGKRIKKLYNIRTKLKKTADKNNIMREAMELFFNIDFIKNIDTNKYLLCFNNGVVDFKEKIFRDGLPEDYITKCTRIDYKNKNNDEVNSLKEEINDFMHKLFPIPELNKYMWDHLSSVLIGSNINQTFNIYNGSGSNGKSMLTDLMSVTLGDYKGTVPITLVTEKRGLIGGTSDEVIKLKGVRYAVMQEPSKGVKLNEGPMKELTGGDPIQARGLYCESEVFIPQFSLVVCTNNLFDINSNDDGTWRRIRRCDFMSKFIDENEIYNDDTKYVFPKNKMLKDRLPIFAPVFASMLVERAFITNGIVEDCSIVIQASNKYREKQDHINAFINDCILKTDNPKDVLKRQSVNNEFKKWYTEEHGDYKKGPKAQEIYEYMDKRFGARNTLNVWKCVKIFKPEEEDDDNEIFDAM